MPFDLLEIGDSFFIPTVKPAAMLYVIDKRSKIARVKTKSYVASYEGHMGVRCWRTQ